MAESTKETADALLNQKKLKYLYTVLVACCFGVNGFQESISVMLLDLSQLYHTGVPDVSYGVSVKYIGYGVGSLVVGWSLDHVLNRQLTLAMGITVSAVMFASLPMLRHVNVYYIAMFVTGFVTTFTDVSCFSWIIEMWCERNNPLMLTLSFALTITTAVSSLVMKPFLSSMAVEGADEVSVYHDTRIHIPCFMLASIALVPAALMLLMFFKHKYEHGNSAGSVANSSNYGTTSSSSQLNAGNETPVPRLRVKIVSCLLLASMASFVINSATFFPTFIVFSEFHQTKSVGAEMTAVSNAVGCMSLLVSIWIARQVKPFIIVIGVLSTIWIGSVFLLLAVFLIDIRLIWLAMVIMYIAIPLFFATFYSFLSQEMFLTNTMFGFLTFSKSVVRIAIPVIVGSLIEQSVDVFIYVNLISIHLAICLLVVLKYMK